MDPVITLKDVVKTYRIGETRLNALDGVSFSLMPGEFACIVGRSGSGKSTLLNMMAGLEKPTSGSITIAGQRIDRMSEAKLVRFRLDNIGFIFQSFNLFTSMTAVENVAVPLLYRGVGRRTRLLRADEMLAAVGLQTHRKHRPSQMSGGQQQRVGIARALVAKPKIIFADEPTGNLDSATTDDVMSLMRRVVSENGHTLIMVTHDREIARWGDKVIHILDGKITSIEEGQKNEGRSTE